MSKCWVTTGCLNKLIRCNVVVDFLLIMQNDSQMKILVWIVCITKLCCDCLGVKFSSFSSLVVKFSFFSLAGKFSSFFQFRCKIFSFSQLMQAPR